MVITMYTVNCSIFNLSGIRSISLLDVRIGLDIILLWGDNNLVDERLMQAYHTQG